VLTQVFNLIFVPQFAHAGLALSIGLGASVNALSLVVILRRRGVYRPHAGWTLFVLRVLPALAALGAVLLAANHALDWLALAAHPGRRVLCLLGVLAASGIVYFAVLFICGFRMRDFTRRHSQA
jgi:putative peptidoglycan lipid II flippase